jgi:hypothetical protein
MNKGELILGGGGSEIKIKKRKGKQKKKTKNNKMKSVNIGEKYGQKRGGMWEVNTWVLH